MVPSQKYFLAEVEQFIDYFLLSNANEALGQSLSYYFHYTHTDETWTTKLFSKGCEIVRR
jgi:hypothetical protein